jgi:ABC-type branched-subunit amino acid transport system substrate-binding protein
VRSVTRLALPAALAACLLAAGCGTSPPPAPVPTTAPEPLPLRTLYVQAPLRGPAADQGRAMVDAVRLVVDQHSGVAGKVRVRVRALDDSGSAPGATDPARCAANAARAAADSTALAVIGTYELPCSKRALAVLQPAGLWLVSPVNAADALRGALRLAPNERDEGAAAVQVARQLEATRVAVIRQRPGVEAAFAAAITAAAPAAGIGPVLELDASDTPPATLVEDLHDAQIQLVALAGSPGTWATDFLGALRRLPDDVRPAVVAPETFDTLGFLEGASAAAEGVRVLSRLVPAEQLGGAARSFASAYADLHGQPPPVATYAADAAEAVFTAIGSGGGSRARVASALASLPAHDSLLGRWAATPAGGITPRRLAALIVDGGAFRVERVLSISDSPPPSGDVK